MEMEIKRVDHLGVIAGVMKDLNLIEAIDERLKKDQSDQENITSGEAVAGMILNGLGFSDKPLSLTPHFFETKALEILFRPGMEASYFNRHKLGKVLDKAHEYGCEQLYFELASLSCIKEKLDLTFNSLDTTSFSLDGEYTEETDEQTIKITHGFSKDCRPDLKQVIQELLVSQDGGVPLMMKSWDGNASDNVIFKQRAEMLISQFKESNLPHYLIADSKMYSESNAINLSQLNFITRIPGNITKEGIVIKEAIKLNQWKELDEKNKYFIKELTHYNIDQRWIVVRSRETEQRARKTLEKAIKKEFEKINSELWHFSNQCYHCVEDAEKALKEIAKKFHYHKIHEKIINKQLKYNGSGRPKKNSEPDSINYCIKANVIEDTDTIQSMLEQRSCFVIGTNISNEELSAPEVISGYKRQNGSIENLGFRFLKDPIFFASSLFLKKPSRIMGLLMVMTLSLLVYSIAQRRIRKILEEKNETLPNQINQPIKNPTMRWIFQLMDGIDFVKIKIDGGIRTMMHGMTNLKRKIILLMGESVANIYGFGKNKTLLGEAVENVYPLEETKKLALLDSGT